MLLLGMLTTGSSSNCLGEGIGSGSSGLCVQKLLVLGSGSSNRAGTGQWQQWRSAVAAVVPELLSSGSSGLCVAEDEEPTGRLFLRNLPFTTTEAELSDAFTDFGDLQEVHLVLDR